ncbi:MAG: pilus assembly protein PilM [Desulfurivibrionaceae bacterium]
MKKNEISSTEKLLNLIKGQGQQDSETPADRVNQPKKQSSKKKPYLHRILSPKKNITVGVDIQPDEIKLIKIVRYSDDDWHLLDFDYVPRNPYLPENSPEFSELLRKTLNFFCGSAKNINIATTISSLHVEGRLLTLPIVPKAILADSAKLTFRKEVPFDEKEMIFDYAYQGEITEGGIKKMLVLAYIAPRREVNAVKDLFARSGYPPSIITETTFSLQELHIAGNVIFGQEPECYLFIGSNWSRIDIYNQGALVLVRSVKTCKNSMVKELMEGINRERGSASPPTDDLQSREDNHSRDTISESKPEGQEDISFQRDPDTLFAPEPEELEDQTEQGQAEKGKPEGNEINLDEAERLLESQFEGTPPLGENEAGSEFSGEKIFDFLKPSVDRLIRQIDRTFNYYSSTSQGRSPARIFLTGTMTCYARLVDYTQEQLGTSVSCLDPFAYITKSQVEIPFTRSVERLAYAPAVGLGLARYGKTPNFLFTQVQKDEQDRIARKDRIIFAVFLAVIVACLGTYIWQDRVLSRERQVLASLKAELTRYQPEVDRPFLRKMAASINRKEKSWQLYQKRYQGLAVISELTALTPANITYQNCNISLAPPAKQKGASGKLTLDGRLKGEIQQLEPVLVSFVAKLSKSPLLDQARIDQSTIKADKDQGKEDNDQHGTLDFLIRAKILQEN